MATRRLVLLLALASVLRLLTQGWDSGLGSPHPDERMVAMATERTHGWFADPQFYAYGSLHFQVLRWTGRVLGVGTGYGGALRAGRALALVASLTALLAGAWLALRAWGRRAALLTIALGGWVPLDLQQSHYATVEAHHAAWVMATLVAAFCLARRPGFPAAALAGAACGASLAVKVTSLGLVLPVAAALLIAAGRRWRGLATWSLTGLAAGLAGFWLGQPWAFEHGRPPLAAIAAAALAAAAGRRPGRLGHALAAGLGSIALALAALSLAPAVSTAARHLPGVAGALAPPLGAAYLHGVGEQVAMVSGRSDLPYVRVYADTVAVLYPLRELAAWGLGPGLVAAGLLAAVAAALVLGRRWRRWLEGRWTSGSVLLILLLAWLVPMTLRLATLEVKFLRYWQPLVVPAVLIAAWGLSRAPGRLRRPLIAVTVAVTVLWGAAYLGAFLDPHPHRTAADWLAPLLAEGDVVAFETWDETLALRGPDGEPPRTVQLPSYDLPDSEHKARQWCETLASADWVVLTSHRVRRTVLANEDRFPLTARLYRLLLAGEAGFTPLARVDRAPRLLGLELPVQLADESFVNYDFPRVVVLRRTATVDAEALAERVRRPLPFLDRLDFRAAERQLVGPLPAVPAVPGGVRQVVDALLWLGLLAVLGGSAWILLLPALRSSPDAGIGLALASGWIGHAWLLWMTSELGLATVSPATATTLVLLLAGAAAVVAQRRREEVRRLWRNRRRGILTVLTIALAVGGLFLAVRAANPAIHWGEKPMDFTFLNAFARAEAWPPGEPWMAGAELHYYYFGAALAAAPILVVGCTPGVGYNLAAATVPMLSAAVLAGFGLGLARRRRLGAGLLPLLVLLTGNLAWPWLLPMATERAASWADLAHWRWFDLWWATSRVVPGFAIDEYPLWTALFADLHGHFVALPVLLATLAWGLRAVVLDGFRWRLAAAAAAVGAAVLAATNPWDLLVLSLGLGCAAIATAGRPAQAIARLAVAAGVSLLVALPFVLELAAGLRAGAGGGRLVSFNVTDFAPASAILRHFGVLLLPLAAVAVTRLGRDLRVAAPLAAAGITVALALGSAASALAIALAALFLVAIGSARDPRQRLAWTFAGLAMLGVSACEHLTLVDRMNTLFKVYNGLWVLLAVALGLALVTTEGWRRRLLLGVWLPLEAVALVNLPLGVLQGILEPRMRSPRPTIDGQAFLEQADPSSWWLVRALQGVAAPGDVIAEAAGPPYGPFTRLAMHTGQPTVVGWPWHLQQRGQPRAEIDARYDDLGTLYGGTDPAERRRVLDRFRVRWVALGTLERSAHDLGGDDAMAGVPGVVRVAGRGHTALYLVQPVPAASGASPGAAPGELPEGFSAIATLPPLALAPAVGLAARPDGVLVLRPGGEIVALDPTGAATGRPSAPCPAVTLTSSGSSTWLACDDGALWVDDGAGWRRDGATEPGSRLAAGRELWAWRRDAVRQRGADGLWRQVWTGPITAAAAGGPGLAVATEERVTVLGRDGARALPGPPPLAGARHLAWHRGDLWAVAGAGLFRSAGGELPWRRLGLDAGRVAAIAGDEDRLWLVLDDGLVAQLPPPPCSSPFAPTEGPGTSTLAEPRGLAASPAGWFVVADSFRHRVSWYRDDGVCLDAWTGSEGDLGELREPSGVALARDGRLAVADTWNGRVLARQRDGRVEVIGRELYGPRDLAWSADGGLLVADTGNRRLLRYEPPAWEARVVARFAAAIVGLAWCGDLLAVASPETGGVVLLDPSDGRVVRRLEVPGWSARQPQEGYLLALSSGGLLASAPTAGELWRLDPSGGNPALRVAGGLDGVTGLAELSDGLVLASLTPQNRLVRVALGARASAAEAR